MNIPFKLIFLNYLQNKAGLEWSLRSLPALCFWVCECLLWERNVRFSGYENSLFLGAKIENKERKWNPQTIPYRLGLEQGWKGSITTLCLFMGVRDKVQARTHTGSPLSEVTHLWSISSFISQMKGLCVPIYPTPTSQCLGNIWPAVRFELGWNGFIANFRTGLGLWKWQGRSDCTGLGKKKKWGRGKKR